MTDKTKKILIWGSVAAAVILVAVVVKKAAKRGVMITVPGLSGLLPKPAAKTFPSQQYYPGIPPTMNNWDGRGGYSYDVGDGYIDYYDKDDNYIVMH